MKCLIFPYLVLVLIIHSRAYCIPNTTTPDQPLHSNAGEFHGATFILTSNSIVVPRALSLNFGHSTNDDTWPPYYSATSPVNDCGDTEGFHTTGNEGDGPNPVDCASLRDQLDSEPGFWNVTADPGRVDEYILLTSKSTCGLVVKTWANDVDTLIGSEDVRDLINDTITQYPQYQVYSTMSCTPSGTTTNWILLALS